MYIFEIELILSFFPIFLLKFEMMIFGPYLAILLQLMNIYNKTITINNMFKKFGTSMYNF